MPAKINITKELTAAFDANKHAIRDMGLYAYSALIKVVPQGCDCVIKTFRTSSKLDNDGYLAIELAYILSNIPAHGTWYFTFMFRNDRGGRVVGTVMVTKTTEEGIYTKSCKFKQEEIDKIVAELAEE